MMFVGEKYSFFSDSFHSLAAKVNKFGAGDSSSLREGVPAKLFLAQSDFVIMFPELSSSFGEYKTRK